MAVEAGCSRTARGKAASHRVQVARIFLLENRPRLYILSDSDFKGEERHVLHFRNSCKPTIIILSAKLLAS